MGDRLVVHVDRLVKPNGINIRNHQMVGPSLSMNVSDDEMVNEEVPLIGRAESRICQGEDSLDSLESPCACSGSLNSSMHTENVFDTGVMRRGISPPCLAKCCSPFHF